MTTTWLTWRDATERALYGPGGFFHRPEGPAGHFRTSVHASPLFADSLVRLARTAGLSTIIDVGAGRAELLVALAGLAPDLQLIGVEKATRPANLPMDIAWHDEIPADTDVLLVANEWLDNVPVDVVELTDDGPRLVLVDPASGDERLGGPPSDSDTAWLEHWWPLDEVGNRAEVGRPRDEAWAAATAHVHRGIAVAIDYSHRRDDRPPAGTLTGYRDGRQVRPVPDGSCDITAHVALDACRAAGTAAARATTATLTTQREALRALGVDAARPPLDLARIDPAGYLRALGRTGEAAELIDPRGLGGFGWLIQATGMQPLGTLLPVADSAP